MKKVFASLVFVLVLLLSNGVSVSAESGIEVLNLKQTYVTSSGVTIGISGVSTDSGIVKYDWVLYEDDEDVTTGEVDGTATTISVDYEFEKDCEYSLKVSGLTESGGVVAESKLTIMKPSDFKALFKFDWKQKGNTLELIVSGMPSGTKIMVKQDDKKVVASSKKQTLKVSGLKSGVEYIFYFYCNHTDLLLNKFYFTANADAPKSTAFGIKKYNNRGDKYTFYFRKTKWEYYKLYFKYTNGKVKTFDIKASSDRTVKRVVKGMNGKLLAYTVRFYNKSEDKLSEFADYKYFAYPKKTSANFGKGFIKVAWGKIKGAKRYEVQISRNKKNWNTMISSKTNGAVLLKCGNKWLVPRTKYYVRVIVYGEFDDEVVHADNNIIFSGATR